MKAVLISIRPEWCLLILLLKKFLEIRKTRPKIDGPFKCYIYCTKNKQFFNCGGMRLSNEDLYRLPNGEIKCGCSVELMSYGDDEYDENNFLNGKIIGEFICDGIISHCEMANADIAEQQGCIKREELLKYSNGKELFGWHISNLKIYDKPKELYEFYRKCEKLKCEVCEHLKYQRVNSSEYDYDCEYVNGHIPITRAPQSWCYVEEVRNDD
ncbi:MAG: hypothetical protein IKL10_04830 [Clostridia bacterium]|nr:hypothetical protein [Clostridia bacterium]